ncbi:MAG TPA: alpha/beta hydrolase [Candidatus Kapabacteria bacterium]|nr:alpha/beta hydrolase [Candidatus Kapabacteria bacterium]
MQTIYMLSGVGADERLFSFLKLPGYELIYLKPPDTKKGESIEVYAKKCLPQITYERPILLGVSFGGMLAIEIAKLIEVEKVILISSIKQYSEFSRQIKFAFAIKLHKLLRPSVVKILSRIAYRFFRTPLKHVQDLQRDFFFSADGAFISWAVSAISNWHADVPSVKLFHIQGSNDVILPAKYTSADVIISGGTHFMIVEEAEEINTLIADFLKL